MKGDDVVPAGGANGVKTWVEKNCVGNATGEREGSGAVDTKVEAVGRGVILWRRMAERGG